MPKKDGIEQLERYVRRLSSPPEAFKKNDVAIKMNGNGVDSGGNSTKKKTLDWRSWIPFLKTKTEKLGSDGVCVFYD